MIVAIGGPLLGAIADQSGRRKPWLATFTLVCVAATAALWFVRPAADYVLPALVTVAIATIGYEFASIFYNAMLPSLAAPERIGRWSGWGWATGYAGGLACLLAALGLRAAAGRLGIGTEEARDVRVTFLLVAAWFLVFSLPLLLFTPDRQGTGKRLPSAARDGFRQLVDSFRHVSRYAHVVRFLVARMIYNEGMTTVFVMGGAVYAGGTFGMQTDELILFGIALNVTSGLGAAAFAWVDDWLGGKRTVLVSLVGLLAASLAILLAPSKGFFWVAAQVLGIFVGPVQAASRSYLARIAPPNLQNETFGLYALSGKATSFLGPLSVGWLTLWTGSQRIGMSTVLVFFIVGSLLMLSVPDDRRTLPAHNP